jgi:hypothetical protein
MRHAAWLLVLAAAPASADVTLPRTGKHGWATQCAVRLDAARADVLRRYQPPRGTDPPPPGRVASGADGSEVSFFGQDAEAAIAPIADLDVRVGSTGWIQVGEGGGEALLIRIDRGYAAKVRTHSSRAGLSAMFVNALTRALDDCFSLLGSRSPAAPPPGR